MSSRSLLALAALTLAACLPASAVAAIQPGENGAYYPQNGTELLEAVDAVADDFPDTTVQGRIVLADKTYVIDRSIVLLDQWGWDALVAAEGAEPVITSATGGFPLLRMRGESTGVDDITFRAPATNATYALVQLEGRAQFLSNVEVPETAPNVTGILTKPSGQDDYGWTNAIRDVYSEATNAPAVRVTGTAEFYGTVAGGNPTVDIDRAADVGQSSLIWLRGDLIGGPDTTTVLQVRANAQRMPIAAPTITITALRPGATGIRVRGASSPTGSLDLHLYTSTIDLVDSGTAIAVEPGAEAKATTIDAVGLLAIGDGTVIACAAPSAATPAKITIDGIYREAAHAPTTACTIDEQRRVTGDPKFTDRASGDLTPLWGSVLIDASPSGDWYISSLSSNTKPSTGMLGTGAYANDIGAAEYQYTSPGFDDVSAETIDNRGLVRFTATGYDPDPTDEDSLTYEWRFPDGTTATGSTVEHRWATEPEYSPWVSVKVTDRTGQWTYESVYPNPIVEPDKPQVVYGEDGPENQPTGGDPTPTPTRFTRPTPIPTPTPRPTVAPQPPKPPKPVISAFTRSSSAVSRKGKQRQSGIGAPRKGEAGATITLTAAGKVNLTVARVKGKKKKPVTVRGLTLPAGATALHFSARFGNLVLPPGTYEITAAIGSRSVSAPLRIRIRR